MNNGDALGDRMKRYEEVSKISLMRRTPVIVRLDGKAAHTFTRGFIKPFDDKFFLPSMRETMKALCENIQGCVFGYTQSDEITLFLKDWQHLDSDAFFSNEVQKICSITASMATLHFNKIFTSKVFNAEKARIENIDNAVIFDSEEQRNAYVKAAQVGLMFDSRCFNVPKEEVVNNFIWRQNDAARNSILSYGQHLIGKKKTIGMKCKDIVTVTREMDKDWNILPDYDKRGVYCRTISVERNGACRKEWIIGYDTPDFRKENEIITCLLSGEE